MALLVKPPLRLRSLGTELESMSSQAFCDLQEHRSKRRKLDPLLFEEARRFLGNLTKPKAFLDTQDHISKRRKLDQLEEVCGVLDNPMIPKASDDVEGHNSKRRKLDPFNFAEVLGVLDNLRGKEPEDDGSVSALRCIHKGLNLSSSDFDRLRRERTEKLLQEKKLILILDLDHTLLHSVEETDLSLEEEYLLELTQDDPNRSIFTWDGMVTKLRPFVRTFLKEASEMYDMYIYTMGCREYAVAMAKLLDPEGVYFKSKIISREDCTTPNQKALDVVLAEERMAVIIDDTEWVWARETIRNLLSIEKYCFFGLNHFILDSYKRTPTSEFEEDEIEFCCALEIKLCLLKRLHRAFFNRGLPDDDRDVRQVLQMIGGNRLRGC